MNLHRNKLTFLLSLLIQAFMWFAITLELLSLLYEIFHSLKENYFLGLETHKILVKVLNVIIIYELFTTLLIALEEKKIKLILIIDTAMIFFIRELLIVLFTYKKLELSEGISSALILGILGILRFLYLKYKIDVE
ncbi:MAG: hypothetical protein DSY32_00610 [Aquifex sp.]|nr:MAG: hypothetical protein DSY32_00610 [Aquifex sp.]